MFVFQGNLIINRLQQKAHAINVGPIYSAASCIAKFNGTPGSRSIFLGLGLKGGSDAAGFEPQAHSAD
jgi:hypothetical protein